MRKGSGFADNTCLSILEYFLMSFLESAQFDEQEAFLSKLHRHGEAENPEEQSTDEIGNDPLFPMLIVCSATFSIYFWTSKFDLQ